MARRTDIPLAGSDGKDECSVDNPIEVNAERVLDLDEYTLIMITDLFTEKAARAIAERYEGAGDNES
jgi:hypothetical protein